MSSLTAKHFDLIKKLRIHANGNVRLTNQLENVLWYSLPIVYSSWDIDFRRHSYELSKQIQKRKRIRKYVRSMVDTFDSLYLLSLTFDDNTLSNTTDNTRLRYVREWLNKNTLDYFACLDFGKVNSREHYHAIIAVDSNRLDFSCKYPQFVDVQWLFGFYSLRSVRMDKNNLHKTINYAFKASSYAFKNMNSEIKPFHKRGVQHWITVKGDELDLPF